jgi:uncharacterized iron-regulated membrane protein
VKQTRPAARPGASLAVRSLRVLRELHRYLGVPLALFVIVNAFTGLLLGWKKESTTLQPPTARGTSPHLAEWRSLDAVGRTAEAALAAHLAPRAGTELPRLDRMDVRPERGVVKVLFKPGVWEVQVDPATLAVHSVARRHSDWIEALHDGSLFGESFKQALTSMLALGLIALSVSGVWLWYGPRRLRRERPA